MNRLQDGPATVVQPTFFVVRTPLLPVEELLKWSDGLSAGIASRNNTRSQSERAAAWQQDVVILRYRLRNLIELPEVRQALFLASPSLFRSIPYWLEDATSKRGRQAERALVRYFIRLCSRATPFGLFSGCSLGRVVSGINKPAKLELAKRSEYVAVSRLDFEYLSRLGSALEQNPKLSENLRFWPNTSLFRFAHGWHYLESRWAGSKHSYQLVHLEHDEYLEEVLELCSRGATKTDIVEAVCQRLHHPAACKQEATDYVEQLIASRVILSNLQPLVTGGNALEQIVTTLNDIGAKTHYLTLREVSEALEEVNSASLGTHPDKYLAIESKLKGLPEGLEANHLFQIDMFKPFREAHLPDTLITEVTRGVHMLSHFGLTEEPDALRQFRNAFKDRYDRARVPLLMALDEEEGIGFGPPGMQSSPLLKGIDFQHPAGDSIGSHSSELHRLLAQRLLNSNAGGQNDIELDLSDLDISPTVQGQLPDSFCASVIVAASSVAAIDTGDFTIRLLGVVGPDGVRFLGRFCHLSSELTSLIREHLRQEEAKDDSAIYAEIVFAPESHIGNVLCRPILRDYEIVYLGRSGLPHEQQIPASDLLVALEANRLVLYSARLNRRIIPRLSTAHGFADPRLPSVYRFLCSLQQQEGPAMPYFSWGALDRLDFLPRVKVGRTVIDTARWRIRIREIETISEKEGSERFEAVQRLRVVRRLPRWIVLEEYDQTLVVDLDNALSVDSLVHVLSRGRQAILRELYPSIGQSCVTGPEGSFVHELNIPFVTNRKPESRTDIGINIDPLLRRSSAQIENAVRRRGPADEWLYIKIYGGISHQDEFLVKTLSPLLQGEMAASSIYRWFFVRYADPHQHLRVRFNGPSQSLVGRLLPILLESLNRMLRDGRLWKIQIETYDREVERYGGPHAMEIAEDLFFFDSSAVLDVLCSMDHLDVSVPKWQIALLGLDQMISNSGFTLDRKRDVMLALSDACASELKLIHSRKQIMGKFRQERTMVESLLNGSAGLSPEIESIKRIFSNRATQTTAAFSRLRSHEELGQLHNSFRSVVSNFLHMHVNRVMTSSARPNELVLYGFLFHFYESQMARLVRGN